LRLLAELVNSLTGAGIAMARAVVALHGASVWLRPVPVRLSRPARWRYGLRRCSS